jgi:glyoxylase-like metal-dependent hydrolase (beta-lactamase superfamily II)
MAFAMDRRHPDAPPMPEVERVRPGLWSVPVPIPDNPLGHTNVYVFETAKGPVLIDAGWDDDASWQHLADGLAVTGHAVTDTYGVLVTHMHPDHHGLSGRVQEASGAWVAMHPNDSAMVGRMGHAKAEFVDEVASLLLEAGATADEVTLRPRDHRAPRRAMVVPDRSLADGELVDVPGRRVEAVWTPGHSPGHTCFRALDLGVLLAGDHVLPTITPHIALSRADRGGDPLGDFLASLAKVNRPDVHEVLPAHEHRFTDLDARVRAITAHHRAHLDALVGMLATGEKTLWALAKALTWNRPWDQLDAPMHRAAVNETAAHLRHLVRLGLAARQRGVRPITFQAATPS